MAFALTKDTADHAGSGLIFKGAGGSSSVSIAHSVAGSALNQTLLVAPNTEHLIFLSHACPHTVSVR